MKKLLLLTLVFAGAFATSAFAADPLDFPNANFRIKIGGLIQQHNVSAPANEIKIDSHMVKTGEIVTGGVAVSWIAAPSLEVGDEYVFVVRRSGQKPKTYSGIFKGGLLTVASEGDLTIEVE